MHAEHHRDAVSGDAAWKDAGNADLRGAAGCWGSLAFEGCTSVSGTLAAAALVLSLLDCRAPQVLFVDKAAVVHACDLDALSPAGNETRWVQSRDLRSMKQEQCAAFAAAIARALAAQVFGQKSPSAMEAMMRSVQYLFSATRCNTLIVHLASNITCELSTRLLLIRHIGSIS